MEKEKDYSNLHVKLVLKYYWQVVRKFKISFSNIPAATGPIFSNKILSKFEPKSGLNNLS